MSLLQPSQCSLLGGHLRDHQLLDEIPQPNTLSWNSLIRSHLHGKSPDPRGALLTFRSMLLSGDLPDSYSLPLALSAATAASYSHLPPQLHALALKLGLLPNPFVVTSLLRSYSLFLGPAPALALLAQSPAHCRRNPVPWTLLLDSCLKQCQPSTALQLFDQMLKSDVELDPVALVTVAKACGLLGSLHEARKVHEVARRKGLLAQDVLVGNAILKMYLECGGIGEARLVFEGMLTKDLISWTTMINGYVKRGGFNEGLKLFRQMCGEGAGVDSFSVTAVLPACARIAAGKNGKEIHGKIVRLNLGVNSTVENALMDMYVKSGNIESAVKIFERMAHKDTVSWTVMILGYSLHGEGEAAVELYKEIDGQGAAYLDSTVFAAALHAANTACLVEEGKRFFSLIEKPEIEHYALMAGLLSRRGYFTEARRFIEDQHLTRFPAVHQAVLNGCRIHQNVRLGRLIAEQLLELQPLNADNYVLLSNVYAANGKRDLAKELKETINDMGLKTKKAYSWIELRNKVHVFGSGDVSHPRSEMIYWELEKLMNRMTEEQCVAREDYSLHDVDEERECVPHGHSEMLAIGLGLISGSHCSGVMRVTKNMRVCRNCHDLTKFISKIIDREIILKDPDRFHHFKSGSCSCRDLW